MMRLERGTFVLVKMEYTDEGGCQIPLLLAELPDPLAPGDTTHADYECLVKWWEPEPQPRHAQKGTYDAKWRKWKARRGRNMVHAESEVKRDRMALLGVRFTREAELAGGFRNLMRRPSRKSASCRTRGTSPSRRLHRRRRSFRVMSSPEDGPTPPLKLH